MKVHIQIFAFVLCFGVFYSSGARSSEFEQFQAEPHLHGKIHNPVLSSREIRKYRTILKWEAQKGPNFNGYYRVAYWGCGSNCITWAIINLKSGIVSMRGNLVSCWPYKEAEPLKEDIPDWFENKISSSLLYVYECKEYTNKFTFDTRTVYQWNGNDLTFLRSENARY